MERATSLIRKAASSKQRANLLELKGKHPELARAFGSAVAQLKQAGEIKVVSGQKRGARWGKV
jgi:hypothetical protein